MAEAIWNYPQTAGYQTGAELAGYKVEAADGSIGKVDKHSGDVDSSYIVVDTGPWIFGKQVLLPAGVITRIDHDEQIVYVSRTKDEIKAGPEFAHERMDEVAYRNLYTQYYGGFFG